MSHLPFVAGAAPDPRPVAELPALAPPPAPDAATLSEREGVSTARGQLQDAHLPGESVTPQARKEKRASARTVQGAGLPLRRVSRRLAHRNCRGAARRNQCARRVA